MRVVAPPAREPIRRLKGLALLGPLGWQGRQGAPSIYAQGVGCANSVLHADTCHLDSMQWNEETVYEHAHACSTSQVGPFVPLQACSKSLHTCKAIAWECHCCSKQQLFCLNPLGRLTLLEVATSAHVVFPLLSASGACSCTCAQVGGTLVLLQACSKFLHPCKACIGTALAAASGACSCARAQVGSFVPAESCSLSVFDAIFTRMGASDNLLLGRRWVL